MFRPFAFIGLGLYIGFTLASFIGFESQIFLAVLFVISGFIVFFIKSKYAKAVFLSFVCTGIAFTIYAVYTNNQPAEYVSLPAKGKYIEINGFIAEKGMTGNGKYYYTIETEKKVRIIYYSKNELNADFYDEVSANMLIKPTDAENKSKNIYAYSIENENDTGSEIIITKPDNINAFKKINAYFKNLKNETGEIVKSSTDDESGGILRGMLFGDKSGIDYKTNLEFKRSGLAHTMAVSGMHVMIFSHFIISFLTFIRVPKIARHGFTALFILFYMAFTGFTYPIVRAGLMAIIYHIGTLIGKENDSYNSLGFAASVIMLTSPLAVRDTSFLLSFYSTLGIIVLSKPMTRSIAEKLKIKRKIIISFVDVLSCSVASVISILPIILWKFPEISILGPVSNIIAMPFINIGLMISFLSFIFIPVIPVVFTFLIKISSVCMYFVGLIAKATVKIPLSFIPTGYRFVTIWFYAAFLLVIIAVISNKVLIKRKLMAISFAASVKSAAAISVVLLFAGILTNMVVNTGVYSMEIIQSENGQGNCVFLLYNNRALMISNSSGGKGYTYDAVNFLYSKGIKSLDFLITNGDNPYIAEDVLKMIDINTIICPPEASENFTKVFGGQVLSNDGVSIQLNRELFLRTMPSENGMIYSMGIPGYNIIYAENPNDISVMENNEDLPGTYTEDILVMKGNISGLGEDLDYKAVFLMDEQYYYGFKGTEVINTYEYARTEFLFRVNGGMKLNYAEKEFLNAVYE